MQHVNPYQPPDETLTEPESVRRFRSALRWFCGGALMPGAMGMYVLYRELTAVGQLDWGRSELMAGVMLLCLITPFCGFLTAIVARSFADLADS